MDESRRLQYISYGLYWIVNVIVGPERVIQIRRTITNLMNDYDALHSTLMDDQVYGHMSGSNAEGFRFRSSDMDVMFVCRDALVTDYRYTYSHRDDMTVLRMETEQCRPGFALLRLVPPSRNDEVTQSCIQLPTGVYVSSTLTKQATPKVIPNGDLHGPCDSGFVGDNEVDFAICFRCNAWPESSFGFINRLRRVGWPCETVLRNILNEGCHMVAIGAKGSLHELIEWRISFSFAEKTLIHNMNHYQFLCYGLLKIFLKEALDSRETGEKMLCSYFLKTAVFWEICSDRTIWSATTFLHCFWACFRRLISWVYNGYCPNFFIPENNMFYGKIQGRAQSDLLGHLMTLYNEGYSCLLRCPSLQPFLGIIIHQPPVALLLPSDTEMYSKSYFDICMILEILNTKPSSHETLRDVHCGLQALSLLSDLSDELQRLALSIWQRYVTLYITVLNFLVANDTYNERNKRVHFLMNNVMRKLNAQSFDLLHHRLFSAVYLYRCGFYSVVLKVLLRSKSKIQQPNVMYQWNLSKDKYKAAGGEHTPLTTMMRKVVELSLELPIKFCVPELTMEHQAQSTLLFPPLVTINFLLYLCHHNLQQTAEAGPVLQELAMLVTSDDGQHIHRTQRAISWTVLGICQEMSGELANAYHSYSKSLHDPYNDFTYATIVRIVIFMMKIYNTHTKPYRGQC